MQSATTSYEGQPQTVRVVEHDSLTVYGALIGAIIALAGAIAVLWRRSERRAERQLKAAEDAREREVDRAKEYAAAVADQIKACSTVLEKQREDFTKVLHDTIVRQAEADVTRDAALRELTARVVVVLDATQRRMIRSAK